MRRRRCLRPAPPRVDGSVVGPCFLLCGNGVADHGTGVGIGGEIGRLGELVNPLSLETDANGVSVRWFGQRRMKGICAASLPFAQARSPMGSAPFVVGLTTSSPRKRPP